MTEKRAVAVAHSNIALAKYWGKLEGNENLPATPSLSLTLGALSTTTSVVFEEALGEDQVTLGGALLSGRPLERVVTLLDRIRQLAGEGWRARVESRNDFPTAAGLASSASGFAALALAATRASGLELPLGAVSALARSASASAARSLFGGFAALAAGGREAERVCSGDAFPLTMLVAVVTDAEKGTGSTDGMRHTMKTSPYYPAWLSDAPQLYDRILRAVLTRDFEALGVAAELSAQRMHASMLAAAPALLYFSPVTLAVMDCVRNLRARGTPAFFTIDAGPHVKVLVEPASASTVTQHLAAVPGVLRVMKAARALTRHCSTRRNDAMKVAAPGKLVLSGAYSVLYGAPAIVTAVDRYVIANTAEPASFIAPEVSEALNGTGSIPPAFDASALREGSEKLGLGSSAAILVASLGAVTLASNPGLSEEEVKAKIFPTALRAHARVQAGGSGADVAVSVYGGTLEFRRRGNEQVQHKSRPWPPGLLVEVWWSGVAVSTRELLGRVKAYREQKPRLHEALMKAQSEASERAALALEGANVQAFVQALRDQCGALMALGMGAGISIVTPEVEAMAQVGVKEGAAVLPSGAGGGDVSLYVGTKASSPQFRMLAEQHGQRLLKLGIGARGVHRVDS